MSTGVGAWRNCDCPLDDLCEPRRMRMPITFWYMTVFAFVAAGFVLGMLVAIMAGKSEAVEVCAFGALSNGGLSALAFGRYVTDGRF